MKMRLIYWLIVYFHRLDFFLREIRRELKVSVRTRPVSDFNNVCIPYYNKNTVTFSLLNKWKQIEKSREINNTL